MYNKHGHHMYLQRFLQIFDFPVSKVVKTVFRVMTMVAQLCNNFESSCPGYVNRQHRRQ